MLDLDLMKERFSKLLLGEDMSGGGKGVSSALALSNAITNLAGKRKNTCRIDLSRTQQVLANVLLSLFAPDFKPFSTSS